MFKVSVSLPEMIESLCKVPKCVCVEQTLCEDVNASQLSILFSAGGGVEPSGGSYLCIFVCVFVSGCAPLCVCVFVTEGHFLTSEL